jgi:Domain of unknown function (DUF4380)
MHAFRTLAALAVACLCQITSAADDVTIEKISYHGWNNCYILKNSVAEVVIVPDVGRVMQFRFAGEEDGVFWENRALDGKLPDPKSKEWGNFGGDKTWPAPQSDWPKVTDRAWPPPPAFDSMPVKAEIVDLSQSKCVRLESAIDPFYGIKVIRMVALHRNKPVMDIVTTYQKLEGDPLKIGIWTITQLKDPREIMVRVPTNSRFKDGYNKQSTDTPMGIALKGGELTMKRDPAKNTKIGSDASELFWFGENSGLRIELERVADAEYPDQGSSAEIYTNADPLPYVELELLSPLFTPKVGEQLEQTVRYTLLPIRKASK